MLVLSRSRELFRLVKVQFIHVELLTHRELRGFIVRRATEAMAVLIGAGSWNVCVAVNIFVNLFHVHLLHVLATNTE